MMNIAHVHLVANVFYLSFLETLPFYFWS